MHERSNRPRGRGRHCGVAGTNWKPPPASDAPRSKIDRAALPSRRHQPMRKQQAASSQAPDSGTQALTGAGPSGGEPAEGELSTRWHIRMATCQDLSSRRQSSPRFPAKNAHLLRIRPKPTRAAPNSVSDVGSGASTGSSSTETSSNWSQPGSSSPPKLIVSSPLATILNV